MSAAQFAPVDGYRVPERWNGRSFLAVLPSADYAQMGIRPCRGVSVWVPRSASPWAGDAAEKLITTASCGRRPVVDGQAGEQYASLTRLELPVAVKALAGVWLCVAQLDVKRVIPVHVHVLD